MFPSGFRYYYYYYWSPISGDECAVVVATVLQGEIGYNSTCSLRTTASATEAAVAVAAEKSMPGYCAIVAEPQSTAAATTTPVDTAEAYAAPPAPLPCQTSSQ